MCIENQRVLIANQPMSQCLEDSTINGWDWWFPQSSCFCGDVNWQPEKGSRECAIHFIAYSPERTEGCFAKQVCMGLQGTQYRILFSLRCKAQRMGLWLAVAIASSTHLHREFCVCILLKLCFPFILPCFSRSNGIYLYNFPWEAKRRWGGTTERKVPCRVATGFSLKKNELAIMYVYVEIELFWRKSLHLFPMILEILALLSIYNAGNIHHWHCLMATRSPGYLPGVFQHFKTMKNNASTTCNGQVESCKDFENRGTADVCVH